MRQAAGEEDESLASPSMEESRNVRTSDLWQVAQTLEQLEMAFEGSGVPNFSTDTMHYNLSELGDWMNEIDELSLPASSDLGSGLLSEPSGAQFEMQLPEFQDLPETPAFFDDDDHTIGGLFALLGASTDDDEDDEEPLMQVPLICKSQGMQQEQGQTKVAPPYDLQPTLQRSRELDEAYQQLSQTQSSSCSSASTVENFQNPKYPRLEHCSASAVQGIEPQTLQKQLEIKNNDNGINDIDNYIEEVNPDDTCTVQPPLIQQQQIASSNPAVEECNSGIKLVHTLMACAEAVQSNNPLVSQEMLRQIKLLSATTGGAMGKVAQYFSEALLKRIYGFPIQDTMYLKNDSLSDLLHIHFYETCPYLKFAHFTANQAILEAFHGHKRVHVIDFSLKQGMQWPALIQALALRPGGPPALRLTGIGPPHPEGNDILHDVGLKLAHLADSVNVEFDFRGYVADSLSDIKPWMLDVCHGETLAVNSTLQLHRLLYSPEQIPPPVASVLAAVRSLNPKIFTIAEQEANHNNPVFLERFTEALHYYSTMFDSLESRRLPMHSYPQVMSEMYLARDICNIVACEGHERVERHETLMQWRIRMHAAGFRPLQLGSNAFKQASMLLKLFSGGDGHRVEEKNGCLTLGWHNRPLITASAWHC
ncbi:hypothetical protein SUGI_0425580 [Cryptomeria japonica]|uniref:DELLA protein RGA2 n=1 Tax=Cryptomeria japonica TaxID=3369 RepID=UPI002408E72D|nr:DELLA protein RGA2 [Cryptomeria japonica]GLJ22620.1 hypothetical protein SUGI_0425580 [Cryptomeria japonica]